MSAATVDLYTDYLISSTQSTTATGLSRLLNGKTRLIYQRCKTVWYDCVL
ncbi:MAG: hypothetical protein ABI210_01150 [Abditibacteriaceae bacterium]